MSLDRVDIEGGFDFSKIQGGEVEGIEGGKGRKGMKHRSPRTRLHSRLMRSIRRRSKGKRCPVGSIKDHRKHGRNPSGCRKKFSLEGSPSPHREGRRKYVRSGKYRKSRRAE